MGSGHSRRLMRKLGLARSGRSGTVMRGLVTAGPWFVAGLPIVQKRLSELLVVVFSTAAPNSFRDDIVVTMGWHGIIRTAFATQRWYVLRMKLHLWLFNAKACPGETCMKRPQPVQLGRAGPDILADNPLGRADAEPHSSPTVAEDARFEAEVRTDHELMATLKAEIAVSYRNFDKIVRRLGYDKDRGR
jgi:hypothetical protein